MWSNLLYILPVASILYDCTITEEIKMEGDLSEELDKLFKKYLPNSKLKLHKSHIHATIHSTYPAGTNLWSILDGIMTRFHLMAYVDERNSNCIILKLEESVAWKH